MRQVEQITAARKTVVRKQAAQVPVSPPECDRVIKAFNPAFDDSEGGAPMALALKPLPYEKLDQLVFDLLLGVR